MTELGLYIISDLSVMLYHGLWAYNLNLKRATFNKCFFNSHFSLL